MDVVSYRREGNGAVDERQLGNDTAFHILGMGKHALCYVVVSKALLATGNPSKASKIAYIVLSTNQYSVVTHGYFLIARKVNAAAILPLTLGLSFAYLLQNCDQPKQDLATQIFCPSLSEKAALDARVWELFLYACASTLAFMGFAYATFKSENEVLGPIVVITIAGIAFDAVAIKIDEYFQAQIW